ncbi:spermatogenesis-associated protein 21 [Sapajus apella]|uniref:Spermatogenesis-associated protein 21 n=1 Tax=Sapajus apella TaxID=9515 RepID=A0A6J3JPV5_SAPAP|nr:spermatogenesis-associated protein 21 [Sapajus apella]
MDNRKTQMYTEGRTKAPGTQPSPGLRITIKRAGVEPTIQGVSQVVIQDASEFGSGKQPSSASGGSEKGPRHREAFKVESSDLKTQEPRPPAKPGKKQSSWVPQKGSQELQAGQDQSELGLSPSWVPEAPEGLQQPGSGKEIEGQQGRQRNPGTREDQPPESCQGTGYQSTLGHQADMVQPRDASCPLESHGQPLRDKCPKEAGIPHIRPQEALPELSPGGHEESSQESMSPVSMVAPEEKTANPFLPSMPGPKKTKEGVEAVETQPAPGPFPPPEVRDIGERSEPDHAQQQLQDPVVAAGTQSLGNPRQGFIKCLLEVEEVEASHQKALKARSLTAQKSPRTMTRVPTSAPSLPQTPASAPASGSSWARLPAPGPVPAPVGALASTSMPCPVLLAPSLDLSWRMELLHQSSERTLSYAKARQEPGEHGLQKLCQNWEERPEEHLTLKQEEAFRSYFEIFNGPGEVDAQSLKNILLLVGFSVTPAQVKDALMSADVNGDGHVDFKDFLAVMTDTRRFFCSVEQNTLMNMAPHNPHTLLFEILSQLVEMLALPEAALEEITNYYQKKLKAGTCKAQEMEAAIHRLRLRKKIPYNPQQEESSEVPERKVLSILSRLKQQNYAPNLQSPYGQVPCIPLCPRLDKKMVRGKPTTHHVLDQCVPSGLDPDIHSPFFQSGSQGNREHNSDSRKWLSSTPARTH